MKTAFHFRVSLVVAVLTILPAARVAISGEKDTNVINSATNQIRVRMLTAPSTNAQGDLPGVFGIRHSRIATDAGFFDQGSGASSFRLIAPSQHPWEDPETGQKRLLPNTDAAESINAEAMRAYQQRFELKLKNPRTTSQPILYPTRVQQMLEEIK
jgi:hypothetical protein